MIKLQKGQVFLLVILVIGVVLISTLVLIASAQLYYQNTTVSINSEKAIALAEAGVDKAISAINKTGGSYTGDTETVLGEGSFAVTITSKDSATKVIEATGYIPDKTNPSLKKTVRVQASRGVGMSFIYGIQVGEGGLELGNSNTVKGSIYSNGNITMVNSNTIEGDIWVAGGPSPFATQQTDCTDVNCFDFIFGKSVSGENRLDVAQSFKPSSTNTINKVSIKIKKTGSPSDITVRVLKDENGQPDKNQVLANGTLYSSLVTTSYEWIDVTFNSTPTLVADTQYWLMLDSSSDSNNYWSWQLDLAQGYTRGLPKWSSNWSTGNPTWNVISSDLSFKTFMGGVPTSIKGGNSDKVKGSVHANTIDNLNIEKDAYFQTITRSDVLGAEYPGSIDPPPKVFPISGANINQWKKEAESFGVSSGNINTCLQTLGPGKIIGNIALDNSCTVTVKSPIWVTGNFSLGNSNTLKLDSNFGVSSGVIIVDGVSSLGNSNKLEGTGVGSSFLMLLSTFDSRSNDIAAIDVTNSGNTAVLYADKGIIEPGNSNSFKELTAWKIRLTNSSTITYETGLSSTLFTSGPSGSYSLLKGSYQIK